MKDVKTSAVGTRAVHALSIELAMFFEEISSLQNPTLSNFETAATLMLNRLAQAGFALAGPDPTDQPTAMERATYDLKTARRVTGLTIAEIARRSGLTFPTIQRLERQPFKARATTVARVAAVIEAAKSAGLLQSTFDASA